MRDALSELGARWPVEGRGTSVAVAIRAADCQEENLKGVSKMHCP